MPHFLPRWKCHKEVSADKIKEIKTFSNGDAELIFENTEVSQIVHPRYLEKHKPEVGGYFVVYADGYDSFSPAKAFEEGYDRLFEPVEEPA